MKKEIRELLRALEKTKEEYWNISPELGQFINLLIKNRAYKKILEIGSSNGYSGIWIAEAVSETKGKLLTVESKKARFALAEENFKKAGLTDYIEQVLGHAPEDIPEAPEEIDMAFFDATKYEHINYFENIGKRIRKGGIIITDNINSHRKELENYISFVKKQSDWQSIELDIGAGILLSLKTS